MNANSVHVTMERYISSLRSLISHYKATFFGRVHVLIARNKTSLLLFCTHTVISKVEHCTKSQWRYITIVQSLGLPSAEVLLDAWQRFLGRSLAILGYTALPISEARRK